MHNLLNRLSGKISLYHMLMGPPDAASNASGSGTGGNQSGADDSGKNNQNNANAGGDDDDSGGNDDDDDSEPGFDDIFKRPDGQTDDDFDLPDDGAVDDGISEEQKAAGVALGQKIKNQIGSFALKEEDLADVDFNDKAAVATFMTQHSQKQITATMQMLPDIINHALGITLSKIDGRIQKAVSGATTKNDALKEFNALGYKGSDREFAMTVFKRAVGQKMTPAQAAKATQNAMSQLGKPPKPNGGRRDRSGNDSSYKTGDSALDSMFT